MQVAVELQIVGRVGEDHVDRFLGQLFERRDAIALQDRIEPGARGDGKARRRQAMLTSGYPRNTRYCLLTVMVTDRRKDRVKGRRSRRISAVLSVTSRGATRCDFGGRIVALVASAVRPIKAGDARRSNPTMTRHSLEGRHGTEASPWPAPAMPGVLSMLVLMCALPQSRAEPSAHSFDDPMFQRCIDWMLDGNRGALIGNICVDQYDIPPAVAVPVRPQGDDRVSVARRPGGLRPAVRGAGTKGPGRLRQMSAGPDRPRRRLTRPLFEPASRARSSPIAPY